MFEEGKNYGYRKEIKVIRNNNKGRCIYFNRSRDGVVMSDSGFTFKHFIVSQYIC